MGIKEYLKKKYEEQKEEWADERKFQKKLAKKRKEAHREALLKERTRIAAEGAKAEAEVRLKKYKEKIGYAAPVSPIVQRTPSVRKIVKKLKGKKRKGKRKKILKNIIKARAPVVSKPKTDYGLHDDITRGLPA